VQNPFRAIREREKKEKEDRDVTLGQVRDPPNKILSQMNQAGVLDHSSMSGMQRGRCDADLAPANRQKQFVRGNKDGANNSFTGTMNPEPKSNDK
jgi:hypothetical protein